MLTLLIWRLICAHILGHHTRDWHTWDSMGIARCLHCHRTMPTPDQPPRVRL
jgi:hypothetical protein